MSESTSKTSAAPHRAGLFDIRYIIGALLGVYGLILVLTGIFGSDSHVLDSTTINVWGGIGMLVVAIAFGLWARLRPIIVPTDPQQGADERPKGH
jgi:hypothetical membrane protein